MKIIIDTDTNSLIVEDEQHQTFALYSDEAFAVLSRQWLKVGWNQKYSYAFTWLGRPIIQLPEDLLRIQEVIYLIQPDVIIETGIAHGGSLIFYATLCHALGKGRVVGVDIEIRPNNRAAIEQHSLFKYITLIEGNSTSSETVEKITASIAPSDKVLVILDSNHSYQHVWDELNIYANLVTPGSYLVATDGIMQDLYDVPAGNVNWINDHPARASRDFATLHPEFILQQPPSLFHESRVSYDVTYWPSAWLRKV